MRHWPRSPRQCEGIRRRQDFPMGPRVRVPQKTACGLRRFGSNGSEGGREKITVYFPNRLGIITESVPNLRQARSRDFAGPKITASPALDRDVQHRWNQGAAGAIAQVKLERLRDLLVPVLENPSKAGEAHWTGVKVHGWLKEAARARSGLQHNSSRTGIRLRTVRYLHELGYSLRVRRPWPERQNEEERNAFLEQLRTWQADPAIELWFADECGVEGAAAAAEHNLGRDSCDT